MEFLENGARRSGCFATNEFVHFIYFSLVTIALVQVNNKKKRYSKKHFLLTENVKAETWAYTTYSF